MLIDQRGLNNQWISISY